MIKFEKENSEFSSENMMKLIQGFLDAGYTKNLEVFKEAAM